MYENISEYMLKSREERRGHLDLSDGCIEIGGKGSKEYRGLLAHHLKTTIPVGKIAFLCHACNNPVCSNTNHLYWGTPADNQIDYKSTIGYTSIWDRLVLKHGLTEASNIQRRAGSKMGKGNAGKVVLTDDVLAARRKIVIDSFPEKFGWVSRAAKKMGISHTQVRRFVNTFMKDSTFYKRKTNVPQK